MPQLLDVRQIRVFLDALREILDRQSERIDNALFGQLQGVKDVGSSLRQNRLRVLLS